MRAADVYDQEWNDKGQNAPILGALTFTRDGLTLGRGVCIAAPAKGADGRLLFDPNEAHVISLLSAAHGRVVGKSTIKKIQRACELWIGGEPCLAQLHLAFIDLPQLDETAAYRLFLAGKALEKGVSPAELMKALGFSQAALDFEKYREDQLRVPAGSGRESGRWTSGAAGGSGPALESRLLRNAQVKPFVPHVVGGTVSDANPDGIVPGAQYAQANPTPVLTAQIINKIERVHGPGAEDGKGEFYPAFDNAESIKWLVEQAWEKAIPTHVYAGQEIDRVVIGARAYVEDDTGKHPLYIGRSGRGLKTPSSETDTYVVILDSNNNVITCYPINPADVVYPYEE